MTKLRPLLVLVAVALLGAPACGRSGKDDDGFRLRLDGRAKVESAGRSTTVGAGKHGVVAGDVVHMLDGTGVLELPGERSVLLRADGEDSTVVDVAADPEIVDGEAVVVAGEEGARFHAGDVEVRLAEGAARVQRGLSVTVAVYRGRAEVRSAGRELAGGLDALRQVSIAASGQVPRDPSPLVYDDKDPDAWDRQFLGDAIDLGGDLDRISRGLTGQLGPRVRVDATLLERVLPPLSSKPVAVDRVSGSSAGEAVVGAAIAVEASSRKDLTTAWDEVFDFRADGAKWGLVALDQRVKRDALNARLEDAAGRSPLLFAATPRRSGNGGSGSTTRPTTGGSDGGAGGGGSTTTTQPPQSTPTTVPTPLGPITVPPTTIPPTGGDGGDGSDGGGGTDPSSPIDVVTNLVDDLLSPDSTTTTTIDLGGLLP